MAIKRKLVISIFMLALTIVTLGSTTYAWFVSNANAQLDEVDLKIENTEGLLVSLDGVEFYKDLSKEQIIQAIEKKMDVKYDTLLLDGVSLKHDDQGKIMYDSSGNPLFVTDALSAIEGTDRFSHTSIDAKKESHISFDLYFKAITTGGDHPNYQLKVNEFSIYGLIKTIMLDNKLTTTSRSYKAGDSITVRPSDAMRVGVTYSDNEVSKTDVYEPNLGFGSSAIEGATNDIHNKFKNAMYTYYNNTHPLSQFTSAATAGEGFETLTSYSNQQYGTFTYDSEQASYNVIPLTIDIWLEGWDADYFMGASPDTVSARLSFTIAKNN